MWKRATLLLAIASVAACAKAPAPAPKAPTTAQPPVATASQATQPTAVAPAGSLQGQWDSSTPSNPGYSGTALIDAQHRVTFAWNNRGKEGNSFGYAKVEFPKVEIFLTDRAAVSRFICSIVGPNRMECRGVMSDGQFTVPVVLTRVGPGPASLMPASQ